ncbi:MAG: serine/threonine protein kinase [Planctomycetaceae bacterium]|nr:serine/threonine protein kinase [Planctomycetaceae bacterium]
MKRLHLYTLIVFSLSVISVYAEDWPQFRGPNSTGVYDSDMDLPTRFSDTENVKWSANLGDGIGSPIVADGRVFVASMIDQQHVGLHAFDADSGKRLWTTKWHTPNLIPVHKTNSQCATTPAADSDRVYFYFSTLGLIALDAKTGETDWTHDIPSPFFVFRWGPAMSPTLYKDKVIFLQDDDLNPAIVALNKSTGKVEWRDDRSDQAVNYSHPVICRTDTGDEIVVAGTGMLIGYNPDNGERKWHARVLLRNIKTTPVVEAGVIYISVQSGGIANQWLASADRAETGDNNGKLSKDEMHAIVPTGRVPEAFFKKTFDRGDLNKDGFLEGKELDIAFLHPDNFAGARYDDREAADEYVLAVRSGGAGDVTETHLLWKTPTKYTDHIVSPLVSNGRMLLIKGGGIRTVFDTKKGKSLGRQARIQNTSEYFASPVVGDGKIYIAGENGVVVVLEDSKDYTLLAKNDMGDAILATPAVANGNLIIRTRSKLICVGN